MFRGLKEGIPMHNAVTHIFRIRKPGNHSENTLLLAEPEIGLKSHDVKKRALGVILSELHNGKRFFAVACSAFCKTDGLQRSVRKGQVTTLRHDFNRHTPFKNVYGFKLVQRSGFRRNKRAHEFVIFTHCHRAIQIITAASVTRGSAYPIHIKRFERYDRSSRIKEMQAVAEKAFNVSHQITVCKRSCGNYRRFSRDFRYFPGNELNIRMFF